MPQRRSVPPLRADDFGVRFAEAAGGLDRRPEVQTLVLRLLDQHHGLERVDVVDALLLALGRNLGLVRPVVELHLGDPCDLADLAEVELHLREVVCEIYRFKQVHLSADRHIDTFSPVGSNPLRSSYRAQPPVCEEASAETSPEWGNFLLETGIWVGGYGSSGAGSTGPEPFDSAASTASPLSASTTGARLETRSPSRTRMTIPPCVERPIRRM